MATTTAENPGTTIPKGYEPISSSLLRLIDRIDVDLYVMTEGAEIPALLREAGYSISKEQIEGLMAKKSDRVLIRGSDYDKFTKGLLGSLDAVVEDDSIDPADRFNLVQTAAAAEIEHACSLLQPEKYVALSQDLGANLSTLIASSELMPSELFAVARHDYHTFSHVTNVACYVSMLAEALGITDETERHELAVGAMLHDIGKRHTPGEILRKPGRLTDAERRVIEEHPRAGYVEVVEREDLSRAQLMMIYQHHEKVAGGGYPVGITAEEIHPWAKMTAVVDIFDAVTGSRPYRDPMPKEKATQLLEDLAGSSLDKEVVKCFTSMIRAT